MGENSYKIELGVDLNESQLNNVKQILNSIENQKRDVVYKVDFNIKNVDKILQVGKELDKIKLKIDDLKTASISGKSKGFISVDAKSLETSVNKIHESIKKVRSSLGTVDSKRGVQSLLTTVNHISKALEKVSSQFADLNRNLNNLSGKDFSINLDFGSLNQKNPDTILKEYKMLRKEAEEYERYFGKVFSSKKSGTDAGQNAVISLVSQYDRKQLNYLLTLQRTINNSSVSSPQTNAYLREYIGLIKEAASVKGYDLSIPESRLAESGDFVRARNEISETEKKLKELFSSGIDAERLSQQLNSIVVDLGEIKTVIQSLSSGTSLDGLTQSFDRLSNSIEALLQNATLAKNVLGDGLSGVASIDTGAANKIEKTSDDSTSAVIKNEKKKQEAYQETADAAKKLDNISIDISDGNVDDLKNALRNLKVDDSSIENATKELNEMNIVAKSVSGTLKEGNLVKWDIKGIQTTADGLERVVTVTRTLGKEGWANSTKYSQSFDKIATAAQKVRDKLKDTGANGFEAELQRAHTEADKLQVSTDELQTALKRLDAAMEDINSADQTNDAKRLAAANEEYEDALKQVYSQLKLNQQIEKDAHNTEKLDKAKESLSLDMDNWLKKNSAAAKEFGGRIRQLQSQIDACDNEQLDGLKREFQNIKKEAELAGKTIQTFGDRLKGQFSKYTEYLSIASMYMYAEQAFRSMFEQVKLIDSAMTELKKVTNETDASYDKFLTNAATRAKEIGTTIDGLVGSTADFARLGYGFEDAQGLAEVANIYAVVGDEIEGVEGATESLISTLAAFKSEMGAMSDTDFAMSIIDKFNEVSNNYAISSGGIGEAMKRSASSLEAANNTIDESIAMITAAM